MIEVENLTKIYGGKVKAVNGITFTVKKGESLCLIGTSGCGKTTTLKMLNRLIEPTSGSIKINNQDILQSDPIQLRRKIGYVIQKGGLFPHMTIDENIGLLLKLEKWEPKKIRARVEELLEIVNLPAAQYYGRYPAELSGGQQQRVGVARSMALNPPIILLDEPFGALDPITREQIQDEFLGLKETNGLTSVMVTHDMQEAFKMGDKIALMDKGQCVQIGTMMDFMDNPANEFVEEFLKHHTGIEQVVNLPAIKLTNQDVKTTTLEDLNLEFVDQYPTYHVFIENESICGYVTKDNWQEKDLKSAPQIQAQTPLKEVLSELLTSNLSALPVYSGNTFEGIIEKHEIQKLL